MKKKSERIILGIDPGTTIMGFGIIKVVDKEMQFVQLNELQLKKYPDHYVRLRHIFERTIELIDSHHPDEIAIEAPLDRKSTRLNSSHVRISYAVFCLKKKTITEIH